MTSKQPRSHSSGLRDLGCHAASGLPQTNPQCGCIETATLQYLVRSWTVDYWRDCWPVAKKTSSHAKGGHFEYSLWTDNADFIHVCRIQCDLFDCYIINKCKKNCCFITMCKAHSKVTHIKQQNYFHHLKRPGYNAEFLLYPRPFRWWKYFCCFICHFAMGLTHCYRATVFFTFIFAVFLLNLLYTSYSFS